MIRCHPRSRHPPWKREKKWYHWYFNTERGRRGLDANRREICRLLWRSWSPNWRFDDETFERTARSFDNPDFVAVVVQEYRHSHGGTPGDPNLAAVERYLAGQRPIEVPSMILHGAEDTVHPPYRSQKHMHLFPGGMERRIVPGAGHFVPRERPDGSQVQSVSFLPVRLDTTEGMYLVSEDMPSHLPSEGRETTERFER
jgi:pimeloyl-ACP methyl ester carboxylesterase